MDKVDKILHDAFEAAYSERLHADAERFLQACLDDQRVSSATAAQYNDVLRLFKRFAQYGKRRFS